MSVVSSWPLSVRGAVLRPILWTHPAHHAHLHSFSLAAPLFAAHCIDEYATARAAAHAAAADPAGTAAAARPLDPRLEAVAERMFGRCLRDGAWTQGLGLALEARRLDWVRGVLTASSSPSLLSYAFDVVSGLSGSGGLGGSVVGSRAFRVEVLRLLAERYAAAGTALSSGGELEVVTHARVLQALGDAQGLAALLASLLTSATSPEASASASESDSALLVALQVGFDVADAEDAAFASALLGALPQPQQEAPAAEGEGAGASSSSSSSSADASSAGSSRLSLSAATSRLRSVIDGSVPSSLWLDWLSKATRTDQLLLKQLKGAVEARTSVLHHALLAAHGLMAAGTSTDTFLRGNMEYLAKAANWAKFSVTASQGVIHRGQPPERARALLASYLPPEAGAGGASPYSEGGALYAVGLIAAAKGATGGAAPAGAGASSSSSSAPASSPSGELQEYLLASLRGTQNEVLQHGSAMGLGLAGLGSRSEASFSALREVLFQDSAVAGEAAGIAIGLTLAGAGPAWTSESTGDAAAAELLGYAHETQHEKTIRGIAMGLALQCAGCEEGADGLIRQMGADKDALLRYGAQWATGLAYAGTGNNGAVRALLHAAVSDVSDDVRRAAVTSLGLVLLRSPQEVPRLVGPLAESYNPHVRYGAALATGFACAGCAGGDAGLEALALLEPLMADPSDFVRQGALIGVGLVLQGTGHGHLPKAAALREKLVSVCTEKHAPSMARMGALLGLGLADMGGRNVAVSMLSRGGALRLPAVIGVALFAQYWYWFPMMHCVALAGAPLGLAGLRSDLTLPPLGPSSLSVACACPPSWFAYPPPTSEKKDDAAAKVTTVTLSVTAKAKARAAAKAKEKAAAAGAGAGAAMEVEGEAGAAEPAKPAGGEAAPASSDSAKPAGEGKDAEKKPEPEAESYSLAGNPVRVTPAQAKFLTLQQAPAPAEGAAPSAAAPRYSPLDPRRVALGTISLGADGKVSNRGLRAADIADYRASPESKEWPAPTLTI